MAVAKATPDLPGTRRSGGAGCHSDTQRARAPGPDFLILNRRTERRRETSGSTSILGDASVGCKVRRGTRVRAGTGTGNMFSRIQKEGRKKTGRGGGGGVGGRMCVRCCEMCAAEPTLTYIATMLIPILTSTDPTHLSAETNLCDATLSQALVGFALKKLLNKILSGLADILHLRDRNHAGGDADEHVLLRSAVVPEGVLPCEHEVCHHTLSRKSARSCVRVGGWVWGGGERETRLRLRRRCGECRAGRRGATGRLRRRWYRGQSDGSTDMRGRILEVCCKEANDVPETRNQPSCRATD
jgi:hypothetical protein